MNFYLKLQRRSVFIFGLLFLSIFSSGFETQAYQIRGGDAFRVMQSGNPAASTSYTVNSVLRIEGNGVTVEGNAGALEDVPLPTAPVASSGGPKVNQVVYVCSLETDDCVAMFPTGSDEAYTAYENCLGISSRTPASCAEDWTVAKGFLPESEYLALKEAEENKSLDLTTESPSLIFDIDEGLKEPNSEVVEVAEETDEFLSAAPVEPVEAFELGEVETAFEFPEPVIEKVIINRPNQPSVDRVVVPVETLRPAAPIVPAESETLVPREPSISDERDYFTCFQVPYSFAANDLWEWLAYKLFFILIWLIVIIFLLALWVFLLWRRMNEDDDEDNSDIKNK